jgi:CRP-like cAMP-binding protein
MPDGSVRAVFGPGDIFGEVELMYRAACSSSVVVTSAICRTFALDRQTYRAVVVKGSRERRKLYEELLSHVSFLSTMTQQELLNLADALQPSNYAPGEPLIKHGEENEWMHIIMAGEVDVIGRDDFNKPVHVCTFGRGQPVGELEFINKHKAVADVVAKDSVTTVRVNRRHFELVMGPCIEILRRNAQQPVYSYYVGKLDEMRNTGH